MSKTTAEISYPRQGLFADRHFLMQGHFRDATITAEVPRTFTVCTSALSSGFASLDLGEVQSVNIPMPKEDVASTWTFSLQRSGFVTIVDDRTIESNLKSSPREYELLFGLRTNETATSNSSEPWLNQALAKVAKFAELPTSWDGEGGPRISATAIGRALDVLASLPESFLKPHIAPVIGGGMQFEWETRDRALEIEILSSGEMLFLRIDGDEEQEGAVPGYAALQKHLIWMAGF